MLRKPQPELDLGADPPPPEPPPPLRLTPPKRPPPSIEHVAEFFDRVVNPLRAEIAGQYDRRVQAVRLDAKRHREVCARLDEFCAEASWADQQQALEHVARNAAQAVHDTHGKRTRASAKYPRGWDPFDALKPDHWLAAANFARYFESVARYQDPSRSREHTEHDHGSEQRTLHILSVDEIEMMDMEEDRRRRTEGGS